MRTLSLLTALRRPVLGCTVLACWCAVTAIPSVLQPAPPARSSNDPDFAAAARRFREVGGLPHRAGTSFGYLYIDAAGAVYDQWQRRAVRQRVFLARYFLAPSLIAVGVGAEYTLVEYEDETALAAALPAELLPLRQIGDHVLLAARKVTP
ncbi:MAG: hypothetical protein ACKVX7_08620 [Planctomycetota bacterium]